MCSLFGKNNPGCDAVVPSVWDWESSSDGKCNIQFLVKSYPTVFVLFLRSFAPNVLKKYFENT
ncbi:hypothetical protein LEP1GSC127_0106 [Leptospira kirschneri str. 200801925]|nr:hypothetical protein LEP1GSC127_0106 [Leptospira kirschneri str. 200801925]